MISIADFFSIILYMLGSILLVVLIILIIKAIKTMGKVNDLLDDVSNKSHQLDGVFNVAGKASDALDSVSDKVINFFVGLFSGLINSKRKKKEDDIDE